ncbi:uncharacterized protein SPAPADRAFT_62764 [Spathaspora passalidarum NRRL Y-27907]|uniref:Uncharacterized protein n=1 Tax=Spathaspora passalidarum (strain NRRL Y-27907 / 11-Y1) TaxID=619300 RepID=G3ATA2_SPAPN|nr:uncharacterized protein SPAPADRAFT_62764 [Spathaspora passalidarum NRRL Y-27907]EGW30865.1 hypothetical protein SPAPADRAFT_62764 [Spathaspora passalidarum NRRL Y-27907]
MNYSTKFPSKSLFVFLAPVLYLTSEFVISRFSKSRVTTGSKKLTSSQGSTTAFFDTPINHHTYRTGWIQDHFYNTSNVKK